MIVRISGEDQFRLADGDARLDELDNVVTAAVESGDEAGFAASYAEMLDYVRSNGERVAVDELEPSDLILPPADLTFAEAGREFTGDGLIPD
jgi:PspA-Associated protein